MSFVATDPSNRESENTWFAPKVFIEKLGPFDLDPCTVSYAPFRTAKSVGFHDTGYNGLADKWHGDVWLNPPYGKQMTPFIDKFIEHRKGCLLIFARMGNVDVQRLISLGAYIYCLRKRIRFLQKDGKPSTTAGTDSLLVFFDRKFIERVQAFEGTLIRRCSKT